MWRTVVVLILLGNCACAGKIPPSFGFYGKQCKAVREVMCLTDAEFTPEQCLRTVPWAIAELNDKLGHQIFHFGGMAPYTPDGAVFRLQSEFYLFVGAKLPRSVLALTSTQSADHGSPQCISTVLTRVSPLLWGAEYERRVVLHEMVHAIGGAHAVPGAAYHSLMTPSVNDSSAADHLTAYDLSALHSVY